MSKKSVMVFVVSVAAAFTMGVFATAFLFSIWVGIDEPKTPARDPGRPLPEARALPKPGEE